MKYFLLEADPHIPQPQFRSWHKTVVPKKQRQGDIDIPQLYSFEVELLQEVEFMDIITRPCLMLSKEFYKLVLMYDKEIKFKYVILTDLKNRRYYRYGIPLLNEVDCLAAESELNMDHSVLKRAILRREALHGRTLLRIGGVKNQYVVASLELVESAFRREVRGLSVKELEIK